MFGRMVGYPCCHVIGTEKEKENKNLLEVGCRFSTFSP